MKIIVSNNIRIEEPDEWIKDYVEDNLVIVNPDYIRNERLGKWNEKTSKYLVWYQVKGTDYILPFGCLQDLLLHYSVDLFELRISEAKKIDYKSNIELFDYQQKVCEAAIRNRNGILIMPAGSGKTQTALQIITRLGFKTLWITHTIDLLNQSFDRAKSNLVDVGLGKISNGKINIGSHITFATVQTLSKLDLNDYIDEWNCIVVDECHRVCGTPASSGMFYKVINKLSARYKYGLTATPYRNVKGTEKAMFSLLGNKIIEINKEVVADRIVPATIVKIQTEFNDIPDNCLDTDGTIKYSTLTTEIANNAERNQIILDIMDKCKNDYTLVLGDRVGQLEYLKEKIGYGNLIHAKTKKDIREQYIQEVRDGKEKILFATYGLAKEGLDIPRLNKLILASPHRDKATIIQSVGRIERKFEGKIEPLCYDIVDDVYYFENMYSTRKRYYKQNGNKIIDNLIQKRD